MPLDHATGGDGFKLVELRGDEKQGWRVESEFVGAIRKVETVR